MKLKVLTCQAGIAAAMLAVAPASHADFLSDIFGSPKEPAVLPLTTSQILQKKFIRLTVVKSLLGKSYKLLLNAAHATTWFRKKVPALYLEANSMPVT